MNRRIFALVVFWIGVLFALLFAGIGTRGLMQNLRALTIEENNTTIWADGGILWITWGFSVTLGSVLAGIGAFIYVKSHRIFSWLTSIGVLGIVFAMVMVWSRIYNSTFFGLAGTLILLSFFALVWTWIKRYADEEPEMKTAGSFKLIGYIFLINASWFLCGETARMHLKAFEGKAPPTPIEVMVFLLLGWVFILFGNYREMHILKKR